MNCEHALDLISARLDGSLSPQDEAELNAHLQTCPACRAIAEQMTDLHSALNDLGEVPAPAALSQGVMTQIKREKGRSRRFIRQLASLAACLVLCVGVLRIADATHSEHNRGTADPNLPDMARIVGPQPVAANRLDAYSLPILDDPVTPSAHLLDSVDALTRFLTQFPQADFSLVTSTYDEAFFQTNRLLAAVLQEPSSSITHRVIELTEDRAVILRDVPEMGDCAMARWLLLAPTDLAGPERPLTLELISE